MKLLLVQCAALGYRLSESFPELADSLGLPFRPLKPVFPAVTCTASATMRTAAPPASHGIVANGRYDRAACKVEFWQQSARLVRGERIWQHRDGLRAAMIFHQQNLGELASITVSPAPVHKHHGGMIQALQTKPAELEQRLNSVSGRQRPFALERYWGPCANEESSKWIAMATCNIMSVDAPDLLMTYIPLLDYVLQKSGPEPSPKLSRCVHELAAVLRTLKDTARNEGYETLFWGDYAITAADTPIFINRALREAGLFKTRTVHGGMTYPNLYDSDVVPVVDHQLAHIYVQNPAVIPQARAVIEALPGVEWVKDKRDAGLDAPEAGELIALAAPGAWFTYRWWDNPREAPDYATHIDIHNKIGFDPCELFWGFPPLLATSMDPQKVRGTHGRDDSPAAFAVSDGLKPLQKATSLLEISTLLKQII